MPIFAASIIATCFIVAQADGLGGAEPPLFEGVARPPAVAEQADERTAAVEQTGVTQITPQPPSVAGPPSLAPRPQGTWYARADRHQFDPALADAETPMHYMRLYLAPPVRFTEKGSGGVGASNRHLFWDVGFGEEFFLLGRD